MKNHRKTLFTGIAALGLVAGLTVASPATPAQAASCDNMVWSYANNIYADSVLPNPCYELQVRMFRYEGGQVRTYYGRIAKWSSVDYSNGSNAGNGLRVHVNAPSLWNAWGNVPVN